MKDKIRFIRTRRNLTGMKASLTVEAAMVLPVFVLFFITFLFFIQVFIVQEHIQKTITKTGLSMAKTAYVYSDFLDALEAKSFDQTVFGKYLDFNLQDLSNTVLNKSLLKTFMKKDLDTDLINKSCIMKGFDGLDFGESEILIDSEDIDIIVEYRVKFPVFSVKSMKLIQRVRLRAWNGVEVLARYSVTEEGEKSDETKVYITETGTVYHLKRDCSHLKISVTKVAGLPVSLRNENGGRYYSCEACGYKKPDELGIYYITSSGDRYHTTKNCSKLKRTVREVSLSEVSGRSPCKRCGR